MLTAGPLKEDHDRAALHRNLPVTIAQNSTAGSHDEQPTPSGRRRYAFVYSSFCQALINI